MLDEGTDTTTTKEQVALEKKILPFYQVRHWRDLLHYTTAMLSSVAQLG